ncbi:hypothetical protein HWN40_00030 [Methanolobus zinderi]|jgi:hypothetical protein|uniref:Uncharacterized protein n=1 Tax=Methanolobus zinderi TaxID=536044 RepID=A0A7D5E7C1_9EURY|nr:hypothetical protein [Methanolobus zinderi]KXS40974.1 MAG: hypothetical protein AWU59_2303 [Methanolobus sp. T82-4]QLC48777.1 hypothetical protein HWN40_00030 [Methanolobus zinderi]
MESLKDDTKGQWIALSGLVISLILIGLAALANQAMLAGYHSSNAALEFPKENIRELNLHTKDNARIIRDLSLSINQTSNETVPVIFENLFDSYSDQVKKLHAVHGETVNVSLVSINSTNGTYNHDIDMILVNIRYNDGNTYYASEPEMIEVRE